LVLLAGSAIAVPVGCGDGGSSSGEGEPGSGGASSTSTTASAGGESSGNTTNGSSSGGSSSSGGGEGKVLNVKRYGAPLGQTANAVAHFANGDVVVVGTFFGSVDFGNGTAETSKGHGDIFVARYTPEGTNVWVRTMGNAYADQDGYDDGYDVAVDPAGDVVVAGHAGYGAGWPEGFNLLSGSSADQLLLAKLSGDSGLPIWGWLRSSASDGARGVAADAMGNALLAGSHFNNGGQTVAVYKFSTDGEQQWLRQDELVETPSVAVAVAAHGSQIYVTGYFEGSTDLGGTPLASAGGRDVFVAKYDENGNHISSVAFGGAGNDEGIDIAVSQLSGDVVLTGSFEGTVDFGGGALDSAGLKDGFVVKLGADGAHLWSQGFGGPVDDAGLGIALDGHDRVYLSGYYQQVIDLGLGPLTSAGVGDVLVAKLEPTGEPVWNRSFGGSAWDEGAAVSVAPEDGVADGTVAVVGSFQGTATFDDTELSSAGSADAFVLQLEP